MKGKLRLQRALKSALDKKENVTDTIPGLLGTIKNGKKRVKVTNRNGFVYVRLHGNLSETVQAYNDQVLQLYDMPVLVKRVHGKGYHYYVSGKDTGKYANWGGENAQAQYAQHGNQHSFGVGAGGSDVVWVFKKQFMPLSLYPYSGTSVRVTEDWYQWGDIYKHFTGSVVDIGTAKPAMIGDSRFVTLYLDGSTNTVKGVTGSLFSSTPFPSDVTPYINVPTPAEGIPLSAVLLTADTVNIAWNNIYDDIRPIYGVGSDSAFSTGTIPTVGLSLYLTNNSVSSTITGSSNYALMITDSDSKHEIRRSFTTSGTIIATFIDEYHNVGYVNAGQWSANLSLNAPFINEVAHPFVYVEMWKKKADGTEVLISVTPHNAWGAFSGENRYSFVGSVANGTIIESDSTLFIRVRAFHDGSVGESSWLGIYVNKEANSTINLPASPFYGGGHVFEWNENTITQRGYANFIGAGVHVYDNGTDTVISIPGTITIQQNGAYKGSGTTLNFAAGCFVAFTGSVAYINVTGTGIGILTTGTSKGTASNLSFDHGLYVNVSGTNTAYIQSIDTTLNDVETFEQFIIGAHRGDINPTDGYPENTLMAMISAAWKGAKRIELDVQTSSDGVWYLMHDATVDRTTNGTGNISDKTAAQLDALWIDGGYGYEITRHSGTYHPPSLESVLTALYPFDVTLQVDNKNATGAANLAQFLIDRGWKHRVAINAATQADAQAIKAVCPSIKIFGDLAWDETDYNTQTVGSYTAAQILAAAPVQIYLDDPLTNYGITDLYELTHAAWNVRARGFVTWDLNKSIYEHHKCVVLNEHINDVNAHSGTSSGGGGSSITIYGQGTPKTTGTTAVDFGFGFSVTSSGTVAYIGQPTVSGTSTYVRAGAPEALTTITGAYWVVPDHVYATGTLSLFINGVAQSPTIDFTEQWASSGTYKLESVHPTGTIFTAIWGVPVVNALNTPPYDAKFVIGEVNAGIPNGVLKNYLYDNYDVDVYPTVPSAWDDEFEGGGALDVKWTIVNNPTGSNAINQTSYNGYAHVGLLELGTTDNFDNAVRMYQAPPTGSVSWEYIAKASIASLNIPAEGNEYSGVFLYLGNSIDDQFCGVNVYFNDSASASFVYSRMGSLSDNGAGGFTNMTTNRERAVPAPQFIFLKLKKTTTNFYSGSNTYEAYGSINGIIWEQLGTMSKTFSHTCDEIGLMFRRPKLQSGTAYAEALVDFFRKV